MTPIISTFYRKMLVPISIIYRKIFHEEVSPDVEKFIKNLSYVGAGTALASIFSFSFNILAGRLLGPTEYGSFTLVQSVSQFLYIPMLLSFNWALVKYNAEEVDFFRQRRIISTTYILVLGFTVISLLIFFLFSEEFMAIFSVSHDVYYFSVLFAVLFVFYTLTTETLRSLHMIREYSRQKPIFSVILLVSFLVFVVVFNDLSYRSPLFSMLIAYGVTGGALLVLLRSYIRPEFSREWAYTLHRYSSYSLMGGISSTLYINLSKIIINIYMSVAYVGIYYAYNYSFTTVILLLTSVFTTVFFPVASMCADKMMLFRRVNRIVILYFLLGWPFVIVTGSVILKSYGDAYPFDLTLALLFALSGICMTVNGLYFQIFNTVGADGVRLTSFAAVALMLVNVILTFVLVPEAGLTGAIVATIIGYIASIGILLSRRDRLRSPCAQRGDGSC